MSSGSTLRSKTSYLLVIVFKTLDLESIRPVLETLPRAFQALLGPEAARLLSPQGFMAIIFIHPIMLTLLCAFPIAFASGALAGEVERRSIALVLVRPISRGAVVAAVAFTLVIGTIVLASALWIGLALWTALYHVGPIDLAAFAWAAGAGIGALWTVGGVALLGSAATSESGRAAGIGVAFALGSYILNYLAHLSADWAWLARYSVFAYWDPQHIVRRGAVVWPDVAVLLVVAAVSMTLAGAVFARRDVAV